MTGEPSRSDHVGPGLYVHVPFCSAVCPYCDFAVTTSRRERRQRFVDCLIREIEGHAEGTATYDTIYFGGGTPSILDPDQLDRILQALRLRLNIARDAWISLEVNPEDVDPARVAAWRGLDVRTVSLGVQSLDDRTLGFLGRRHRREQAIEAVELCLVAGFATVSIDLIYGIQDRTIGDWERELTTTLALGPHHMSCYNLTYHEGTPFGRRLARGELLELDESDQAALFRRTHELLNGAGMQGYEVSNFAACTGYRSRHNQKYWNHTEYLGLGPSAHSFRGMKRWWNQRELARYEAAAADGGSVVQDTELLTPADLALEALMLGLRTYAGVDLRRIHDDYGIDLRIANAPGIARLGKGGYLVDEGDRLAPTLRGLAVADAIAREFTIRPER